MRVTLLLFAVLRDIVGTDRRDIEVAAGSRAIDLWEQLRHDHIELSAQPKPPMTAINESYAPPETVLEDGDEVAFIPPVSGG